MVTIEVNEVINTVTINIDKVLNNRVETAEYSYNKDEVHWEFIGDRFLFEKKMELPEFEHTYIFNFPQSDVYIKYINPNI